MRVFFFLIKFPGNEPCSSVTSEIQCSVFKILCPCIKIILGRAPWVSCVLGMNMSDWGLRCVMSLSTGPHYLGWPSRQHPGSGWSNVSTKWPPAHGGERAVSGLSFQARPEQTDSATCCPHDSLQVSRPGSPRISRG